MRLKGLRTAAILPPRRRITRGSPLLRIFRPSKLLLLLLTGGALSVLPMSGCGNGGEDPDIVIAPIIQASFVQTTPTQTDRVVFMDNVVAAGDIINADLVVRDT